MEVAQREFIVGQVVLAKMKGYPPWPALIVEVQKENKKKLAKVSYFGCDQWSLMGFKKLTPILAGEKIIDKHYGKNKQFTKAIDEMKIILKIENFKFWDTKNVGNTKKTKNTHKHNTVENELLLKCKKLKVVIRRLTEEEIAAYCAPKKNKSQKKRSKC